MLGRLHLRKGNALHFAARLPVKMKVFARNSVRSKGDAAGYLYDAGVQQPARSPGLHFAGWLQGAAA